MATIDLIVLGMLKKEPLSAYEQPDWLNKYARFSIDCTRLMNQVHLQMSSVS